MGAHVPDSGQRVKPGLHQGGGKSQTPGNGFFIRVSGQAFVEMREVTQRQLFQHGPTRHERWVVVGNWIVARVAFFGSLVFEMVFSIAVCLQSVDAQAFAFVVASCHRLFGV